MRGQSALEQLRAAYRDYQAAGPLTHEVPVQRAAAGNLIVVYKEPDWEVVKEAELRWLQEPGDRSRNELNMHAEVLVHACVDIKLRDGEEWLPGFGLEKGDAGFHAAATELGLSVGDDPVAAVFAVLASDWEVDRHFGIVNLWEPAASSPEAENFVGESETPAPSTSSPEPA